MQEEAIDRAEIKGVRTGSCHFLRMAWTAASGRACLEGRPKFAVLQGRLPRHIADAQTFVQTTEAHQRQNGKLLSGAERLVMPMGPERHERSKTITHQP